MSKLNTNALLAELRATFNSGRTQNESWRRRQLLQLRCFLQECRSEINDALAQDLGKSAFESELTETDYVLGEINYALRHLRRWLKPRRVRIPLKLIPGRSEIRTVPYGVALILAPWNYPLQLSLAPLTAALAAGNCVLLKPSELASATAELLAKRLPEFLDSDAVSIVEGGAKLAAELVELPIDFIFYTGGTTVGRKVMTAAAANLTPLVLELGGKSPCIVDETANIEVAARRIVWGKFLNAGQTCVAPDYVLVSSEKKRMLLDACKRAVIRFFGNNPRTSPDFSRIINDRHFLRLTSLLHDGEVIVGGDTVREDRYIAPTILQVDDADAAIMQDEIFGPILPVLPVDSLDAAVGFINSRPKPLALYLFSGNKKNHEYVLGRTDSGGVCINDVIVQLLPHELPFGGVGESGFGSYHGFNGFQAFSHQRSLLVRGAGIDPNLRYPPYSRKI